MKMYELLSKEEAWIQGTDAARLKSYAAESRCNPRNDHAACWCLDGAKQACYTSDMHPLIESKLINYFAQRGMPRFARDPESTLGGGTVNYIRWNDAKERKWEEVRDVCKELDI